MVVLQRPMSRNKAAPQFLEATVLPGRGMAVLQIKAYLPGKGEIDLLNSPPLPEAEQLLDKGDDEFGNQVFKMGGAILLPFANRIRGKLAADGKTITAQVAGKTVTLPANWSGNNPGAEKHAIHGLMLRSKFENVKQQSRGGESSVTAVLHAGNFNGHWLSDTEVQVETTLNNGAFEMTVTAKNVGHEAASHGDRLASVFPSPQRRPPAGQAATAQRHSRRHEQLRRFVYHRPAGPGHRHAVRFQRGRRPSPGHAIPRRQLLRAEVPP